MRDEDVDWTLFTILKIDLMISTRNKVKSFDSYLWIFTFFYSSNLSDFSMDRALTILRIQFHVEQFWPSFEPPGRSHDSSN